MRSAGKIITSAMEDLVIYFIDTVLFWYSVATIGGIIYLAF